MKTAAKITFLAGPALIALTIIGCLVSGTFVVDEMVVFSSSDGFYSQKVDLTEDPTWADHQNDIDRIEKVGLEVWITRTTSNAWTFNAYVADTTQALDEGSFDSITKYQVFGPLTVTGDAAPGTSVKIISYADSFAHLDNVDHLLVLADSGHFNLYGTWASDPPGSEFGTIDSVRVIVTLTASN